VFVSGLGGKSVRSQSLSGAWWASIYTSSQGATYGALFGVFNFNGEANKAHFYFKAINGAVPDDFFVISNVTPPDATPPSTPAGLTAAANGEKIDLAWMAANDAESGINGYKIYRGTTTGGETFLTQIGNVTSYTDQTTLPNTTYFYQISAVNGAGLEGSRSNEANVTTGDTPPTAPTGLTASAGNQQITLDWADNSEPDLAGYHVYRATTSAGPYTRLTTSLLPSSNYTDVGLTNGTTYYYVVTATDAGNNESTNSNEANAKPNDRDLTLIGHWKFDEGSGTVAADASGNGNNGTLLNGPTWTTGRIGGAVRFDGNNDYVNLPSGVLNGLSDITTAFWIKTSKTGKQAIFSGANSGNNEEYLVYFTLHTQILLFSGESPSSYVAWNIASIANGQWHHVAVIRDDRNNMVTVYIDGVSQGAKVVTLNPLNIAANGLVIGQEQDAVGGGFDPAQAFAGDFDELRIYNRVLSAAEIAALTQRDATAPSAPAGLTATASGEQINLSWTAASDAESGISGYKIYRGTTAAGETFLAQVGNVTSYTDGSTSPNTTYFYQVSALNGAGLESVKSNETSAVTGNNPPAAPAGLSASAGNQQISLNWNDNSESDLAGYHVYRSTTAGGPYTRITTNLVTVSAYTDAGLTNGTTYYYVVTAEDVVGNASANSNEANATPTDIDPTLVGYWRFDEGSGTIAADASGNGNNGTLLNGPTWTTGRIGGAVRFDGNNDYVNLPSGVLNGLSNVTTAFWIKTSKTGKQAIFSGANSGNNEEYLLYFTSHTQFLFFAGESPSSYVAWNIASIANGQWHHVAVVRDDANNRAILYIDGTSQAAKATTLNPLSIAANGLVIGQEQDAVGGGFDPVQAFAGDFDELRIYNRVLSATEIQTLANPGAAISKNSNSEPEAHSLENILPQRFYLAQNYPNPFPPPGRGTYGNPTTAIRYELPEPVQVKLAVYDIVGRKIRTLVEAFEPAGFRQVIWDGANEAGARVPSGTYLLQIEAGPYKMTRKLMLMK